MIARAAPVRLTLVLAREARDASLWQALRDPFVVALVDAATARGFACSVVDAPADANVDEVALVRGALAANARGALVGIGASAPLVACAAAVDPRVAACVLVPRARGDVGDVGDASIDRDQTADLATSRGDDVDLVVDAHVDVLARARRIACPTLVCERAEHHDDESGAQMFHALTCVRHRVRGSDEVLAAQALEWIASALLGRDDVDAVGVSARRRAVLLEPSAQQIR